jgi:hypothetical protein
MQFLHYYFMSREYVNNMALEQADEANVGVEESQTLIPWFAIFPQLFQDNLPIEGFEFQESCVVLDRDRISEWVEPIARDLEGWFKSQNQDVIVGVLFSSGGA